MSDHEWSKFNQSSGAVMAHCFRCGALTSVRNGQRDMIVREGPTPPDFRLYPEGYDGPALTLDEYLATLPDIPPGLGPKYQLWNGEPCVEEVTA